MVYTSYLEIFKEIITNEDRRVRLGECEIIEILLTIIKEINLKS